MTYKALLLFEVDPARILSNQFYEDLRKIYDLRDFVKVIPFKLISLPKNKKGAI